MTETPRRCGIIGNSFTFYNDLPKMLTLLTENSVLPIHCDSVTRHGAPLAEHVDKPDTVALLNGDFRFIALQEHSCVPGGANEKELHQSYEVLESFYVPRLLANPHKPVPVLYSTWGHRDGVIPSYKERFPPELYPDYLTMQKKTTEGYKKYQALLLQHFSTVLFVPVGDAFEIVYHESSEPDSKFPSLFHRLFDDIDTFHPSKLGTYLAACCFWGVLSGNSPTLLSWIPDAESTQEWDDKMIRKYGDRFKPEVVTEEIAAYLRDVAHRAVTKLQQSKMEVHKL